MVKQVQIKETYMTLTQLLKEESIIPSGGAAKYYLADFPVMLNGEVEARRGKKLYRGDVVTVQDVGTFELV